MSGGPTYLEVQAWFLTHWQKADRRADCFSPSVKAYMLHGCSRFCVTKLQTDLRVWSSLLPAEVSSFGFRRFLGAILAQRFCRISEIKGRCQSWAALSSQNRTNVCAIPVVTFRTDLWLLRRRKRIVRKRMTNPEWTEVTYLRVTGIYDCRCRNAFFALVGWSKLSGNVDTCQMDTIVRTHMM